MRSVSYDRWSIRTGRTTAVRTAATAVILACALTTGCGATKGESVPSKGASPGVVAAGVTLFNADTRQNAPSLAGTTLNGKKLSLDDVVGRQIVVLNVWASWCTPCRDESPMLAAMADRLRSGVRFIGLDERDSTSRARAFVATTHSTYPHLVDQKGALLQKLKVLPQVGIPSTLVLDRHGRMAARVIGPATASALQQIVDELIKEA